MERRDFLKSTIAAAGLVLAPHAFAAQGESVSGGEMIYRTLGRTHRPQPAVVGVDSPPRGPTMPVRRTPSVALSILVVATGNRIGQAPGPAPGHCAAAGQGPNQHWTRNVLVSPDRRKLYVSVGSASNASPEELPRASVLQMNTDGSDQRVFAWGLRNPVGLAFHPTTDELGPTGGRLIARRRQPPVHRGTQRADLPRAVRDPRTSPAGPRAAKSNSQPLVPNS